VPATSAEVHALIDPAVINMVLVLGHSWALGANGDVTDVPVTTVPQHPGHALMFNVGTVPRGRPVLCFADLVERVQGSTRETPCSGIADVLMRYCQQRFDAKPYLVCAAVGAGGVTLSGADQPGGQGLMRGSQQFSECKRLVLEAHRLARAQNKRLRVLSICLAHHEAETSLAFTVAGFKAGMVELRRTLEDDIRQITAQSEPVGMLVYQANRGSPRLGVAPEVPLAQLSVAALDPMIQCIGPIYCNEPEVRDNGRSTHLKARGYRRVGLQFGRYLIGQHFGQSPVPLSVVAIRRVTGSTIELDYSGTITLEQNDSAVNISDLGPGLGIDFTDGSRGAPTIQSVGLSHAAPNRLEITLSSPSTGPKPQLFIAARPTGNFGCGKHEGARSGIRSRDALEFDSLDNQPIYNWACTEMIDVPVTAGVQPRV
jgi:hypothetical protein